MNDKTNTEAPAVAFFAYKRTDGFEVSLTLRDESGKTVLERIEGAIMQIKNAGGVPVAKYQRRSFPDRPVAPTKPCPYPGHNGLSLKEKILKDGTKLWSHSKGVYPNLTWCNGKGYPDEQEMGGAIEPQPYEY